MLNGKITAAAILALLAALPAIPQGLPQTLAAPDASPQLVYLKNTDNKFATNFFTTLVKQNPKGNILVSPLSLAMALQMVSNAAEGETKKQLLRVFSVPIPDLNALNKFNTEYMRHSAEFSGNERTLDIANGIFLQKGFDVSKSFTSVLDTFYKAPAASVDFNSAEGLATINSWVSDRTKGKIASILAEPDPSLKMVLVNAVYFKGNWEFPFHKEATSNQKFYGEAGEQTVPTMSQLYTHVNYMDSGDVEAIELPYTGSVRSMKSGTSMRMLIILPKKGKFESFQSKLSAAWFEVVSAKLREREGSLKLPKFKMSESMNAQQPLELMGIKAAFTPGVANFSKATTTKENLSISAVLHKVYMDVNEQGTEAAAVTAIKLTSPSVQPPVDRFHMVVDRPFIFAIKDEIGNLLFMGRITKL